MKPSGPTRRASPLAMAGFHPHFTSEFIWRARSGKRARHLDVSYNFLLLSNKQFIGAKMSAPPASASLLSCVHMEDFQSSWGRSRLRGLALSPYKRKKVFIRGMTRVAEFHQRGLALLGGLARLYISTLRDK